MKYIYTLVLFCLLSVAYALDGTCIRVKDGDTIDIQTADGVKETIRLNGIDAPESKQAGGMESRAYLAQRIQNKKVHVDGSKRDVYGRLLGTIYLGNENINLTMVRQGLAWDYVRYNAGAEYTKAEQEARAAKLGIWASDSPLPPWEFRHPSSDKTAAAAATAAGKTDAAQYLYWVSNSGKTHNRHCKNFLGNSGTGYYTNTPSGVDGKCCGGASRK